MRQIVNEIRELWNQISIIKSSVDNFDPPPQHNYEAIAAPVSGTDNLSLGYTQGSEWIYNGELYKCTASDLTSATWVNVSAPIAAVNAASSDLEANPSTLAIADANGELNFARIRAGAWQPNIAHINTTSNTSPFTIQIKTNITFTNVMYWLKLEGYNYGGSSKPIDSVAMGYAYQVSGTIINDNITNRESGLSIDAQYKSADNFVCLEVSSNTLYFIGFVIHAQTANPGSTGFVVNLSEWAISTTRY